MEEKWEEKKTNFVVSSNALKVWFSTSLKISKNLIPKILILRIFCLEKAIFFFFLHKYDLFTPDIQ